MNWHFERKEMFCDGELHCESEFLTEAKTSVFVVVCRILPKIGSTGRITLRRRQTMPIKRHAVALSGPHGGGAPPFIEGSSSLSKKVLKSAFKQ